MFTIVFINTPCIKHLERTRVDTKGTNYYSDFFFDLQSVHVMEILMAEKGIWSGKSLQYSCGGYSQSKNVIEIKSRNSCVAYATASS